MKEQKKQKKEAAIPGPQFGTGLHASGIESFSVPLEEK